MRDLMGRYFAKVATSGRSVFGLCRHPPLGYGHFIVQVRPNHHVPASHLAIHSPLPFPAACYHHVANIHMALLPGQGQLHLAALPARGDAHPP